MKLFTNELSNKDFHSCYEDYRQRFNRFADEADLKACINDLIVSEMEQGQFKHEPYMVHIALDAIKLLPSTELLNLDFAHTLTDYHFSYQDHKESDAIMSKKKLTSDKLIRTIEHLGPPNNYIQALALSKLLNNINVHFMDPIHYHQYQNIREELKVSISRFGHREISTQLEEIEKSQLTIMDDQEKYREMTQKIFQLQQHSDSTLQVIESTMPTQANLNKLREDLEAQGIIVNDALINIIHTNTDIQHSLVTVITALKEQEAENQLRKLQQKTENDYYGISQACHFVSQLGSLTGSKDIYHLGNIVHNGIQIHKAMSQILANSLTGAALLGPYSAIGLAALSILSIFKHAPDPNQIIMKQIQAIMRQIRSLHKDMISQFGVVNERLAHLLEVLSTGFEHTQLQLNIMTNRKLYDLQNELKSLNELTKAGFEELLLDKLRSQLSYLSDLELGISNLNNVTQRDYEATLRFFSEFVLDRCCSPLFNGSLYQQLYQSVPIYNHKIIQLLQNYHYHMFENLLGPLVLFVKANGILLVDKLNENTVFQPELWAYGVSGYIRLKKLLGNKFHYDPQSLNIKRFIKQGQMMLNLVDQLRTNKAFYETITNRIKSNYLYVQNQLSLVLTDEKYQLGPQIQLMPISIPEQLQNNDSLMQVIKTFFETNKLLLKLEQLHITVPQEFIQASELGLGKIEYLVHIPSHLKTRTHHKNQCKALAGDTAGIEINFNMGGDRINLYKAIIIDKNTNFKKKYLVDFLEDILSKMTIPTEQLQHKIELIKKRIDQQIIKNNKQLASTILAQLTHSQAYAQLSQDTLFLFGSLSCAGYPIADLTLLNETLKTQHFVELFESYLKNPEPGLKLPTINLASHNELDQALLKISSWITKNTSEDSKTIETLPDYAKTIQSCLSELSSLLVCDDLMLTVEKHHIYRNSGSSSFFAHGTYDKKQNRSEAHQHGKEEQFSGSF